MPPQWFRFAAFVIFINGAEPCVSSAESNDAISTAFTKINDRTTVTVGMRAMVFLEGTGRRRYHIRVIGVIEGKIGRETSDRIEVEQLE